MPSKKEINWDIWNQAFVLHEIHKKKLQEERKRLHQKSKTQRTSETIEDTKPVTKIENVESMEVMDFDHVGVVSKRQKSRRVSFSDVVEIRKHDISNVELELDSFVDVGAEEEIETETDPSTITGNHTLVDTVSHVGISEGQTRRNKDSKLDFAKRHTFPSSTQTQNASLKTKLLQQQLVAVDKELKKQKELKSRSPSKSNSMENNTIQNPSQHPQNVEDKLEREYHDLKVKLEKVQTESENLQNYAKALQLQLHKLQLDTVNSVSYQYPDQHQINSYSYFYHFLVLANVIFVLVVAAIFI